MILVGEMRDPETAEIGLRAAITGHLVLSTLHTRDAMSTPFRLLDMGVPPFMVATSLQAVIAQRLVRLNCDDCAEPHAGHAAGAGLADAHGERRRDARRRMRGRGLLACNGTGYAGRQGVYEMLEMDAELAQAATAPTRRRFCRAARERMQGQTMAHHALRAGAPGPHVGERGDAGGAGRGRLRTD